MSSKFTKTLISAAVMATLASTSMSASALGLGRLNVTSTLNSPFEGEIDFVQSADQQVLTQTELQAFEIALASRDDFERVNVPRKPVLSLLQFETAVRANGTPYIRVYSEEPIQEPYLQFLVTASHAGGKSFREYKALLSPPLYAGQTSGQQGMVSNQPVISAQPVTSGSRVTEVLQTPGTVDSGGTLVGTPYQDGYITGSIDGSTSGVSSYNTQAQSANGVTYSTEGGSQSGSYGGSSIQSSEQYTSVGSTDVGPTREGDTLWSIASSIDVPGGVSLYQVMLALLRENPGAFINGNVNRLRTGQVLRLPDFQAIAGVTDGEAREEYIAQLEAFESFRVAVSGSSATRIASESSAAQAELPTAKTIKAQPAKKPAGTKSAEDLLRIVQANAGSEPNTSGAGKQSSGAEQTQLKSQIAELEEEVLSKDLETRELRDRVKALEERIQQATRLAKIESDTASRLQAQAKQRDEQQKRQAEQRRQQEEARLAEQQLEQEQAKSDTSVAGKIAAATAGTAAIVGGAATAAKNATGNAVDKVADTAGNAAGGVRDKARDIAGIGGSDEGKKVQIKKRPRTTDTQKAQQPAKQKVAEAPKIRSRKDADGAAPKIRERKKPANSTTATIRPRKGEEQGWFDKIKGMVSGSLVPVAIGIGAIIAALLGFTVWRRRKSIAEFEESILSGSALDIRTDTQETASSGTATDTSFLSEFGVPGMGTMQADEVDPIAEAEVYMAYGRDEQAEEVLKESIARDGNRPELKLKLLEIYQQRNDVKEFETLAEELYPANGAESSDVWAKVVEMGQKLNPDNPLFKGGVLAAGAAAVGAAVAASGSGDDSDALDLDNDDLTPFPEPEKDLSGDAQLDAMARQAGEPKAEVDLLDGDDDMSLDFDAGKASADTGGDLDFNLDADSTSVDMDEPDDDKGGLLGGLGGAGAALAGAGALAGGALAAGAAKAGDTASDGLEGLGDMAGGAKDAVSDGLGDLGDSLGDMAGGAKDAVGDGIDGLGDLAGDAKDKVSGGLESAGDALGLGDDTGDLSMDSGLDLDSTPDLSDAGGLDLDTDMSMDSGLDLGLGDDAPDAGGLSLGDDLDFDTGGGDLSLDSVADAAADKVDDVADSGLDLGDDLAGSLDIGADDLSDGLSSDLNIDAGSTDLSLDADSGLSLDLDADTDAGDLSLDLDDDDGGLSLGGVVAGAGAAAAGVGGALAGGLGLGDDLDGGLGADLGADLGGADGSLSMDLDAGLDSSNVASFEDAATKLDLAKAYIDMGDSSGAQTIIDEVLAEGDDGQRAEAAELKAKIATG